MHCRKIQCHDRRLTLSREHGCAVMMAGEDDRVLNSFFRFYARTDIHDVAVQQSAITPASQQEAVPYEKTGENAEDKGQGRKAGPAEDEHGQGRDRQHAVDHPEAGTVGLFLFQRRTVADLTEGLEQQFGTAGRLRTSRLPRAGLAEDPAALFNDKTGES